ncbi:MAG: recombinase family protein [Candidatus Obscuribacterales bacterium]|nr:recombinase family protein [Candidatus Obscuribacterales bacterium]
MTHPFFQRYFDSLRDKDCSESAAMYERLKHMSAHRTEKQPVHSMPWGNLSIHHRPRRNAHLIAYTKYGGENNTIMMQVDHIHRFCTMHGYTIQNVFEWEKSRPGTAIREALMAMHTADGIIVSDLTRLIDHYADPMRDLKPLVHECFRNGKHLIAVNEGIDTATVVGQNALIEYTQELHDVVYRTC